MNPPKPSSADRRARVLARAVQVLGDAERARAWLARPSPDLGGAAPAERLGDEAGAREVEALLGRMERGILA